MPNLNFVEAVRLHPRLSDGTISPSEYDERLLEACEAVILDREIESAEDAVIVLQLAAEDVELGGRADGRDAKAIRRVIGWLAQSVLEEKSPKAARRL
ncbi:MAG: putative RNA-binding protein YlqC (UPF0109 family) [Brevundimonas sp.]|jgi:predicted RNA-binding protein YlqC (UPF0109 family)|uniref:hypothetical protein n=1 Tax=Brevundimonas sp. TaxID=1871086 RepID=UPI0039E320F4